MRFTAPRPIDDSVARQRRDGSVSGPALRDEICACSADEMVRALSLTRAPRAVRSPVRFAAKLASRRLARLLSDFDALIPRLGLSGAARQALAGFGVQWQRQGALRAAAPALVLSNHPGAFDAMILFAALGRDDLAVIADDRAFLRAIPHLQPHLLFVPAREQTRRARSLISASRHLQRGGALLHFGAGCIEPDPAFWRGPREGCLRPWTDGSGKLLSMAAQCGSTVRVAIVQGVHSIKAKRLLITRLAERHGLDTVAFLLQSALPQFGDVRARVTLAECALDSKTLAGLSSRELAAYARSTALSQLSDNNAA